MDTVLSGCLPGFVFKERYLFYCQNASKITVFSVFLAANAAQFKSVNAARGKIIRAEPIAALYELGKVHHVGRFPKLEDQLCGYNPALNQSSPDRLDALVWALSELSAGSGECRAIMA